MTLWVHARAPHSHRARAIVCRVPPKSVRGDVVQKFKGRVLVVDWSLSKHDYGASGAGDAPAGPEDTPADTAPASSRAPQRVEAMNQTRAERSAEEDGEAVPPGSEQSESTEHAESGGDGDSDIGSDAALEIRPEEKEMYRSVLGGLLRDEDTAVGAAGGRGGRAEGVTGASADDGTECGKTKKWKRTEEGQAGAEAAAGAAADWEGERAKQPEGQAERSGSGVISTQVFVRGLPADATSVELTARMSRFGEVTQCRCGISLWGAQLRLRRGLLVWCGRRCRVC